MCIIELGYKVNCMEQCLICDRIKSIRLGNNPYFVKELKTGYVVLGDFQYYEGYTLFLCKIHAEELHELKRPFMKIFLEEMVMVAKAVYKTFHPSKLNYEMLGNGDPHLHWHIFPRYKSDPNFKSPIWVVDRSIRYSEKVRPSSKELEGLKKRLLRNL